jgi:hypothetical protein|tara:strand:+ start:1071 stop:1244 length:174 start_codon:yes stop_codon:yes gene_type:complete
MHNILRLSTVTRWNNWVADLCGGVIQTKTISNFEAKVPIPFIMRRWWGWELLDCQCI